VGWVVVFVCLDQCGGATLMPLSASMHSALSDTLVCKIKWKSGKKGGEVGGVGIIVVVITVVVVGFHAMVASFDWLLVCV